MEESTIRGLVQGAMFFALLMVVWGIKKLFSSPSEGAKRIRLAVYAGLILFVLVFIQQASGFAGVAVSLTLAAVGYWIYRGFKKN